MLVEHRENGALVAGYLDAASSGRADAFDTVLVQGEHPYRAELRPHRFGVLSACDIRGDHGVRVLPRIAPGLRDHGYSLGLMLEGRGGIEQDGRSASLAPGDFVLYTGRRPFRIDLTGPYRYFVVGLGRNTAGLPSGVAGVTADPGLPRSPSGRILTVALAEIARLAPQLGSDARRDYGEHIVFMLRTLLREAGHADSPVPDQRTAVLERVLEHVDRHLAEDLSPDAVAAAHHVSVRYLHALFHSRGETVAGHIRRRRLERIRRDLADPALAHLPAYAIAARWGIRDASHLSRLFRAEFGLSPRAFRDTRP
ncbi:helix-turn-helix domain-containing protein [Nocardiopsis sp. YSL2]|uniref:helix-turn-helix domain-containing protein n=1 Tax=Nocardiopsis sp. YSL2 TaxID=2939492 RepID=UPI0026F45AB8|nr:helix-turn-helix domain-containing protein [Nocardiopsis sp. YSL2]